MIQHDEGMIPYGARLVDNGRFGTARHILPVLPQRLQPQAVATLIQFDRSLDRDMPSASMSISTSCLKPFTWAMSSRRSYTSGILAAVVI